MPQNNVCRLTTQSAADQLNTPSFVKETRIENLSRSLSHNRLCLCSHGTGTVTIDAETLSYASGTLLFLLEGESFSFQGTEDTEVMYIDFLGTRARSLLSRFAIGPWRRAFSGFEGLIPLWSESLMRTDNAAVDLAAESILLYTFSRLGGVGERETLIHRLIGYTEENFHQTSFSLATLAENFSYSAKYLSHLFRVETGVTYTQYLRSLRIRYATTLFDHGIDSVGSVALLSGFSDPLYFSTVFKREVGVSPKEYRAKSRHADAEEC